MIAGKENISKRIEEKLKAQLQEEGARRENEVDKYERMIREIEDEKDQMKKQLEVKLQSLSVLSSSQSSEIND